MVMKKEKTKSGISYQHCEFIAQYIHTAKELNVDEERF
jgi:hypothetical protein